MQLSVLHEHEGLRGETGVVTRFALPYVRGARFCSCRLVSSTGAISGETMPLPTTGAKAKAGDRFRSQRSALIQTVR